MGRLVSLLHSPLLQPDKLAECDRLGLEGIVCKERDGIYRSGPKSGWIKVKAATWREANRGRGELFAKPPAGVVGQS